MLGLGVQRYNQSSAFLELSKVTLAAPEKTDLCPLGVLVHLDRGEVSGNK
jgi:hypothetical protein